MRISLSLILGLISSGVLVAQDLPALYEKVHSAIVSVETSTSNVDESRYGSGFLVSRDGIIITNYHVIRNALSITVKDSRGNSWTNVQVGLCDEEKDLGSLKIVGTFPTYLPAPKAPSFKVGQRVVAIGNPRGLESTLSEGIISGVRKISDTFGEAIQTTAPISPGSSGGPLLALNGEVIGVTTFQVIGGQNLNFAIPVGSFASKLKNSKWLTIAEWRRELVRPEVEHQLVRARSEVLYGRTTYAKQLLNEILRLDDSNEEALLTLARVYVDEWDNRNALRLLNKYLAYDSTQAEAYELRGIGLDRLGHSEEAIRSFEKAVALNDSLVNSRYQLIVLLSLNHDIEKAQVHLDRLQQLNQELYNRAKS